MANRRQSESSERKPWQERHTELLDTAERLFFERGFAAVSLADVAHAAGVTKPIAYRHFGTREAAYVACAKRAQEDYVRELRQRLDRDVTVRQQLANSADLFFGLLETHPQRWELVYGSAAVLPAQAREELAELRRDTIATTYGFIATSRPDVPGLLTEALAHALSGAAERLGLWWKTRPDIDRRQIIELYVEVFYTGIASYNGGQGSVADPDSNPMTRRGQCR